MQLECIVVRLLHIKVSFYITVLYCTLLWQISVLYDNEQASQILKLQSSARLAVTHSLWATFSVKNRESWLKIKIFLPTSTQTVLYLYSTVLYCTVIQHYKFDFSLNENFSQQNMILRCTDSTRQIWNQCCS